MAKDHKEWFRQADYDMGAAQTMFDGGRYIYAVFMCRLAIEKALKGLYLKRFNHNRLRPTTYGFWSKKQVWMFPQTCQNLLILSTGLVLSPDTRMICEI